MKSELKQKKDTHDGPSESRERFVEIVNGEMAALKVL
jgi:hypothetical protein